MIPVSILKPLKGRDEGLEENLRSFFKLDYPDYEILFSVAEAGDPAAALVRRLIEEFPAIRARLIVGSVEAGANPKVNNMVRSYETARYDWLLISDSNIRVEPAYLRRLVAHVDNSVGVVTSTVRGQGAEGWGGRLEAVFLNTFYPRGMMLADLVGRPCVMGKSMLFRRSTANRFGGIRILSKYLAEDFITGEAMRRLGLRVVMAVDPVTQHIGRHGFSDFWNRHVRWGRIRKAQSPVTFALEPLVSPILSGLAAAFAAKARFDFPILLFFALHMVFWGICDALVHLKMGAALTPRVAVAWLVRSVLDFPLWLHIASGKTVQWRGKSLVVERGGLLRENNYATR